MHIVPLKLFNRLCKQVLVRCVLLCLTLCNYAFSKTNTITFFTAGKRRPKKAGSKPQLYEDTSMQPPPSEYGAHHGQGKEMIKRQGVGWSSLFLFLVLGNIVNNVQNL